MNVGKLLRHYERVADGPEAITRLRRFVLDLAVRGRLVAQDPGDEPAHALLHRVERAKLERIRTGQLRQPRELDTGAALDEAFDLPSSWEWVRLDTVGAIVGGGTPPAGDAANFAEPGHGTPWLTPADLGGWKALYISRGSRDLSDQGVRSSSATILPAGSVLFTSRAPIGYVAIAANPLATNQGFKSVVPYLTECSRYVALVLQAFGPEIDAKAPGTTFKEVSGKIVAGVPFPLPPLPEQHRIVAKVDELMALCDRLEAARAEREAARDRLTAASLAHINTPCPETLADDARFALDALPGLTARPDQIRQLRQAILSLAVRGKLLPQDFTDEPATEFLARIAVEKSKIARESGAKEKPEIARDSGDPFDLPSSWTWCQLDKLAWKITDGDHLTPKRESCGQYLLSARNIHNGRIDLSDVDFVGDAEFKRMRQRCDPDRFDVLISCSGSVGRVAIVDKDNAYVMVRSAALVKPVFADDLAPYLAKALMSDCVQSQMGVRSKAAAQPNLFIGPIRQLLIPLPPLTEQHRIVAKVDELMALCDRLEASLATGEDRRRRLLEVLLQESLQTANAREEAI